METKYTEVRVSKFKNNPWYEVVDGVLYFICRGGKRIRLRRLCNIDES